MSIYIIAEAGINHDGEFTRSQELVRAAKRIRADAIKFQLYGADRVCKKDSAQYEWLKRCQLSITHMRELRDMAHNEGLQFLCTPDHYEDAQALAEMKVDKIKIGSAQAKDRDFLKKVAKLGLPMIVSTGMMTEADVRASYHAVNHVRDLTLLHCTSVYPCPADEVNLAFCSLMRKQLPTAKIGYSSHTPGLSCGISCAAIGLDAFEFHLDLDEPTKGPDVSSSISERQATVLIDCMRDAELMIGDGLKRLMPSEARTKALLDERL